MRPGTTGSHPPMIAEIVVPDDWPQDAVDNVIGRLQELIDDPERNAIIVGVPASWRDEQHAAFTQFLRQLRDEISEATPS